MRALYCVRVKMYTQFPVRVARAVCDSQFSVTVCVFAHKKFGFHIREIKRHREDDDATTTTDAFTFSLTEIAASNDNNNNVDTFDIIFDEESAKKVFHSSQFTYSMSNVKDVLQNCVDENCVDVHFALEKKVLIR